MPSLQTHNQSGRKKLIITKEPEAKQITGKDNQPLNFVEFMAKVEGEDSVVKYSSWTKTLSDLIKLNKLNAVIDCYVVVTDQKQADLDGNPYKNRKITQIYQDGEPVKTEQQGKAWGKSPETVAMELDSKARNTALMQACAMIAFDMPSKPGEAIQDTLSTADRFYAWLKGEKTTPHKGIVQPAKPEAVLPVVATTNAMVAEIQTKSSMPANITTGAQLAAFAGKHGIDTTEFIKRVQGNPNNVKTPEQIKAAWAMLFPEGVK